MARKYTPRGETRGRVLDAALELFARHGVSGTSLQMIADQIGVSKASVYHQFQAKEDILIALMDPSMARLEEKITAAEAQHERADQVSVMLEGVIELVLEFRQRIALLRSDPGTNAIVQRHPEMSSLVARLQAMLLGEQPTEAERVTMAVLGSGIVSAGTDPTLSPMTDEALRTELRSLVARATAPR